MDEKSWSKGWTVVGNMESSRLVLGKGYGTKLVGGSYSEKEIRCKETKMNF